MENVRIYILQGHTVRRKKGRTCSVLSRIGQMKEDVMQKRIYTFLIVGLSLLIGIGVLLTLYMLRESANVAAFLGMGRAVFFLPQ